ERLEIVRVEARPLTPIRCNDHWSLEVSLPQLGVEVIDGSQLERDLLPGEVPHSGVALDAGFLPVHDGHRFFKSAITSARTPATILSSASPDSKRASMSPS